jgi:HEAT repeat protein
MKAQEEPAHVASVLHLLDARKDMPSQTVAAALETLASLQRHEPDKTTVRERLAGYLTDPRDRIRLAAIDGLGRLEDPKALPLLEPFAERTGFPAESEAARKALERIRAGRKSVEELSTLRSEITELKNTSRELRKELDAVKKRTEAR